MVVESRQLIAHSLTLDLATDLVNTGRPTALEGWGDTACRVCVWIHGLDRCLQWAVLQQERPHGAERPHPAVA
jgi:hypothetical protein